MKKVKKLIAEVENFRKELREGKKPIGSKEKTELDELIETEKIDILPKKKKLYQKLKS